MRLIFFNAVIHSFSGTMLFSEVARELLVNKINYLTFLTLVATTGIIYSQLTYKSLKGAYILSIMLTLLALQAFAFFEAKLIALGLLVLSYISARVLDRNYIAYICILSIQYRQECLVPELNMSQVDRSIFYGQG